MKQAFCTRITSEMILITIMFLITGAIADQVFKSKDIINYFFFRFKHPKSQKEYAI